ncbi:DMT family transporter [Salinarimonas ramus]|uniref:Membrane protein n=1 Tax=Salinarimonas ramus TaxID=690164 RepID=A0A917QKW3_9HYPH|nr:DMT family transporter [Salinarimonas ramus]GGK53937.1 membrane protein [Salinarimonas ramus]
MNRREPSTPATAPSDLGARLAPAIFVVIWATGFIVARLVAGDAEPLTFLWIRYALAIAVLAVAAWLAGAAWPSTWAGWRDGLVAGVLLHGAYLGGVFWSVSHGLPAGIAALVAGLQPLLTGLLVAPLIGETVSARRWLGIAVGFAGVLLVVVPRLGEGSGIPPIPLAVCFSGVLAITLGTIWQKRTASKLDLRTNTVVQYCGALLFTLPLALLIEEGRIVFTTEVVIGLAWAVLGLSIGAISLLLVLIRRGAVAGVASLLFLVPPCSALMAYLLFGETLAPIQMLGMGVAALGVALASRG